MILALDHGEGHGGHGSFRAGLPRYLETCRVTRKKAVIKRTVGLCLSACGIPEPNGSFESIPDSSVFLSKSAIQAIRWPS